MSEDTVRVAVRIRPLVKTEVERGCQSCLDVVPGEPQIHIQNTDKAFTFNYVFAPTIGQEEFYNTGIKEIVKNIFEGYNVTILAYGQTGSGKTHSMGTDYNGVENMGVIPRAVYDIFEMMNTKKDWSFKVAVSFMELYQEQLYDLLSDKQRNQSIVDIREDGKGIKIVGVTEKEVTNAEETLQCLTQGSMGRATGATAMNAQSSRSHAIFTLSISQQKKHDPNTATTAKFHLVDLAGSERSKKTQATGERFKEGVNINKGLLALGNVISQLGEGGSTSYIGYRDSKLTRLLQDSLGGNSMTLMIACVSPADYNLDETLSTLRYADRARKIKNKPIVNQDPKVSEINRLNKLVQELRLALVSQEIGVTCPMEYQELQEKNRSLQKKIRELTKKLDANLIEIITMHERAELRIENREKFQSDMTQILEDCKQLLQYLDVNPADYKEHRAKLEVIYSKIHNIYTDQKKASEELISYEMSLCNKTSVSNTEEDVQSPTHEMNEDDAENIEYFDEKHEEYTLRQAERNNEVEIINRELAIKEDLVSQLLKNSSQAIEYSKELQEMENEIKTLQSEKEELLRALQNAHTNNISSKLAESRRKKVQELEKKITELSRKCVEQSKVIRVKEKQDQQINILSKEMQTLKQTRVKLIRQMRNDADRFTKWKQSREKELNKLKDQDRKRVNEMTRLKMKYNKQENVFKRKMEEAFAINKRLKEALDVQKKAMQRREKLTNKDGIQTWVTQELQVLLSTVDAECSLHKLMQDRASVVCQLDWLRNSNNPDKEEIAELTEYLDLRNAQIADLQQRILESDQENRANTRFHMIQSMADAKAALKLLFEITVEERKKQCAKSFEYSDLLEKHEMLQAELKKYGAKEKELQQQQQNPHEFTFNLSNNSQEDEGKENQKLKEEIQLYKDKCKGLEQKILTETNWNSNNPRSKSNRRTQKIIEEENTYALSEDSLVEDDVEKDPDWTKTPLYKRIQKLWNTTRNLSDDRTSLKRPSDGEIKCACKTKCATRLCSCRKNDIVCTNCNCNPEVCQNRDDKNLARSLFSDALENEQPDEATKRPRLVE
ncbi:hypothetical protein KM043_015475 [Ampulex compressa]|nr:hypothetical protein KM043_015475 [Ampulex compressa]